MYTHSLQRFEQEFTLALPLAHTHTHTGNPNLLVVLERVAIYRCFFYHRKDFERTLTYSHTLILPTTLLSCCLGCCKVYRQVNERVEEGSFELVASYCLSQYFTANSMRGREKERKKERVNDKERHNERVHLGCTCIDHFCIVQCTGICTCTHKPTHTHTHTHTHSITHSHTHLLHFLPPIQRERGGTI